jgi:hypothetical protein
MNKGAKTTPSVIAVAKDDARFKAVEVCQRDGQVEVLWSRSLPAAERTWSDFAAECGFTRGAGGPDKASKRHGTSVVGLEPTGVVFYRVSVPPVGPDEMAAIVRMQAESLLPLPAQQIEVAWRTSPTTNGKTDVTLAVARKDYLQRFAGSVQDFQPGRILLSCEGTARVWRSLFAGGVRQALVVSIGEEHTHVSLVVDGLVTQAAVLDTGMAALASARERAEAEEVAGRFAQDLQVVLGSFGWDAARGWPVVVLSDGSPSIERIVASLQAAGLPAEAAVPVAQELKAPAGFGPAEIYDYRVPLGLALTALDGPAGALDLFAHVGADEQQQANAGRRSVVLAGALAVVMLIALMLTWYSVDLALARRLKAQVADPNFTAARQHQVLLTTVARHRPDVLQLFLDVNAGQNDGVVLDSIHFKKGQVVTISGQVDKEEQMWKYEENLRQQKGIAGVLFTSTPADPKTHKIKFTVTFQYRNFSKKGAAL